MSEGRKLQTPFASHFANTYIFNPGLYTLVPLHHWLKLSFPTWPKLGMGSFYQYMVLFHAELVWRNSALSQPENIWVSPRNIWVFLTHSLIFQIHPPSLPSLDMPESGLHLQSQLQKLVPQEVRKSSWDLFLCFLFLLGGISQQQVLLNFSPADFCSRGFSLWAER